MKGLEREFAFGSLLLETDILVSVSESIARMCDPSPLTPINMHPCCSLFALLNGSEGHPSIPSIK